MAQAIDTAADQLRRQGLDQAVAHGPSRQEAAHHGEGPTHRVQKYRHTHHKPHIACAKEGDTGGGQGIDTRIFCKKFARRS